MNRRHFMSHVAGASALAVPGMNFMQELRAQAPKRVAMHFKPVRTATWDHRKLGGGY